MSVKQISVFVENKRGRITRLAKILAERKINIRAISIADTTDFGIVRLIVDYPDEAFAVLKEKGYTAKLTDVLVVPMKDRPGSFAKVMEILDGAEINIEYLYAFTSRLSAESIVVFCTEDTEKTLCVLEEKGIETLSEEVVYGRE